MRVHVRLNFDLSLRHPFQPSLLHLRLSSEMLPQGIVLQQRYLLMPNLTTNLNGWESMIS
jgi:hypothetical protein